MTKIIIDSTTDLPDELIEKYHIDTLPLRININSKEYLDKVTITIEEVYKEIRKGVVPVTSSPFPKYIYELFKSYAEKGVDIIYYAFSSKLSGTYGVAYLAMDELKSQYPHVKMEIIDTKGGALASGLIVHQGAKLLEMGKSFEEVVRISEENVKHIEHIFIIDDLNNLLKGGRISKGQAILGGALNIKPILNVEDGEICLIKKARGRKKALKTVMEIIKERIKEFPDQIIGISHASELKAAQEMKEMIIEELGPKHIIIDKIGSVLATHLGLGGVGVFFLKKEPEFYVHEL